MYYGQHNSWGDCEATETRLKDDWIPIDKRLKADKNGSFSGLRKIQAEGLYMVSLLSSVGVPAIASGVISRLGPAKARCSELTRDLATQGERDATGRQGRPYGRIRQMARTASARSGGHRIWQTAFTQQVLTKTESTSCYGRKAFEE
jgi:hypothetical protein